MGKKSVTTKSKSRRLRKCAQGSDQSPEDSSMSYCRLFWVWDRGALILTILMTSHGLLHDGLRLRIVGRIVVATSLTHFVLLATL